MNRSQYVRLNGVVALLKSSRFDTNCVLNTQREYSTRMCSILILIALKSITQLFEFTHYIHHAHSGKGWRSQALI